MNGIKHLSEADYQEISLMDQFAFQFELTTEEMSQSGERIKDHNILAWMVEGKIAAKVHIIPLTTYIAGKLFKMGGIGAVATWPEYRRQGIMKNLLFESLKEMKQAGQTVSFLSPFSFPFYRKYGWELTFTNKKYHIPMEYFKRDWQAKGYLKRVKADVTLLDEIYQNFAKKYTGTLDREPKWWEQNILSDAKQIAVAYSEAGDPEGYLIYQVKNNTYTVKDFAYTNRNGRQLLLEFISNHDASVYHVDITVPENDQLALLLTEPTFEEKINHYFMARIVDVPAFFKEYPFDTNENQTPVAIEVEDSFFTDNSGVYQLSASDATRIEAETSDIQVTIQMLTMIMLGYKRPLELFELGLIQGEREAIEQLETYIPTQQTYIAPADHF